MPPLLLAPARAKFAERACRHSSLRPQPRVVSMPPSRHPRRPLSASAARTTTSPSAAELQPPRSSPPPPPSRWIDELRARVGKCIIFGCDRAQVSRAAAVLGALATEWRELLAGSEGFLTGGRRGLEAREIAWGEMDTFGHVNNVNYYRFAESARVNWITNFAVHVDPAHREEWRDLMTPRATGLIMRSLKADFKFPMVYPDKISVYHKLRSRPEGDPAPTSFFLDCIVLSHRHRRISARLEEDIVIYDYKAAGKARMPGFMLDRFKETWELQEQQTVRARTRIWELIASVERLEKETWARPGAVEDLGSAKSST